MACVTPLPTVADARRALEPGSPKAHARAPHNLLAEFDVAYGDVNAAFATAPHVFRETLWQHRGGGHSLECRGAVARYDTLEERLTLWSSTQTPHTAMRLLADILGFDDNRVRVITPDVGGGFGPKGTYYPEYANVSAAARLLGRPVKWIEDRRENFLTTNQERDQYWDLEIAVDANAKIIGVRGQLIHDNGAYVPWGIVLPWITATTVPGPYVIPHFKLDVLSII